jgi:cyclopropane-fatty-acyl-phospholipid synthase
VLDIGCGWGGLGLYLAEIANARAAEKNLATSAKFFLEDYRDVAGSFDRIVSVGMFEHVGVGFYESFFRKCHALLEDDGVMLLHSIGRPEGPNITNPWIAKYIFPGGYVPALSEVLPAVERAGLLVTDIEILRLHYADTLKAWRQRFLAHRDEIEEVYDARFARMWEFYLAAAEVGFRKHAMMVFQLQLTKRQDVVPMTRDYIMHAEAQLRIREGSRRPALRLAGE